MSSFPGQGGVFAGAFLGGGGSSAEATWVSQQGSATDATSYSFTSVGVGPASSKMVVVGVTYGDNAGSPGSKSPISCTVGGSSATKVAEEERYSPSNGETYAATFYVIETSLSSTTVVVGFDGTRRSCGICVWYVTGYSSTTPTATNGDSVDDGVSSENSMSTAVTLGGAGCVLSLAIGYGGTYSVTSYTPTGTNDVFSTVETADHYRAGQSENYTSGGSKTFGTTWSATLSGGATITACWE